MLCDERFKVITEFLDRERLNIKNLSPQKEKVLALCSRFLHYFPKIGWTNMKQPSRKHPLLKVQQQEVAEEIAYVLGVFGSKLPSSAVREVALTFVEQFNDNSFMYSITNMSTRKMLIMEVFA